MDYLDLVLLVLCAMFGISGYRQGFIVGVLSFAGLIGGALLGATYAASLHRALGFHGDDAVFGLVTFVVLAGLGQVIGTFAGAIIRRRLTWRPARQVDALGGAVVGIVSVLLVSWLVATAATATPFESINREVTDSKLLQLVNRVVPSDLHFIEPAFHRLLSSSGFAQVFSPLSPQPIVPVSPPDAKLARSKIVSAIEPSVVKITGIAPSCSRALEGSGFVISPGHVMTNAHVVAGVHDPTVRTSNDAAYAGHVVLFDPNRDIAVLDVPGLDAEPLHFAKPAARGDSAIVLGYPEDGPFTAGAARIRSVRATPGPNIYQDHQVTRQIYSIDAIVRPGNSGGPLITTKGKVDGVVFAASTVSDDTGYALTAIEVESAARSGSSASAPVSTQDCD